MSGPQSRGPRGPGPEAALMWSSVLVDRVRNCPPNSKSDLLFMGCVQGAGAREVQGGPPGLGRGEDFQRILQDRQGDEPGRLCGLPGWSPNAWITSGVRTLLSLAMQSLSSSGRHSPRGLWSHSCHVYLNGLQYVRPPRGCLVRSRCLAVHGYLLFVPVVMRRTEGPR